MAGSAQKTAKPGDIRFKEMNGDKKDQRRRPRVAGQCPAEVLLRVQQYLLAERDSRPDAVVLLGVYGNKLYNVNTNTLENLTGLQNQSTSTPTLDAGKHQYEYPARHHGRNQQRVRGTRLVEDGSYLRGKNGAAGIQRAAGKPATPKLASLKVYVNVQNPFTITNYSGA